MLNYKMLSLKKLHSEVQLQYLVIIKHGGKVGQHGNKLVFKKLLDSIYKSVPNFRDAFFMLTKIVIKYIMELRIIKYILLQIARSKF
jgi:hypothetical protein